MSKAKKTAVTPTREENFPEWYQQVIKASDMAENSPVRGCMVIKPWGYGIWEAIQRDLDRRIKETGHENCYFPLFIPLSFLEKEAAHVEGFAKEMAVVTHHRLVAEDGKLVPSGKLEEPLVVRPTSETIIGDAFARWMEDSECDHGIIGHFHVPYAEKHPRTSQLMMSVASWDQPNLLVFQDDAFQRILLEEPGLPFVRQPASSIFTGT